MAKKKETAAANHSNKETAEANDNRKAVKPVGVKLQITGGVAYLGWPYRIGQIVQVADKKQADEAVNAGRAKIVD